MMHIDSIEDGDVKVLEDARRLVANVRSLAHRDPVSIADAVSLLGRMREEIYEDLNQIQHEHLILRAAEWLKSNNRVPGNVQWRWNPRQTGDDKEPDLEGWSGESLIISAEVTASEHPVGSIDTHMAKTLKKLSSLPGAKFYFVRTECMLKRARTKIEKNGWPIATVRLDGRSLSEHDVAMTAEQMLEETDDQG